MSYSSYSAASDAGYKSGAMNPVLAKLYFTHGIKAEGISTLAPQDRAGLCNNVAELIETADRQTDREMATDILLSLLREAEKNLKQAVAERLSVSEQAPLRLLLQFINEDIEVAKSVLTNSQGLNDLDLLYIIQSRDSPFWQAIAQRKNLAENVVETLVDTKDIATSKLLIENKTVFFNDYTIGKLAKLANDTDLLNECLINRTKTQKGEFSRKIYAYAGEALKETLAKNCGSLSAEMTRNLDDVLSEFTEATPNNFMPSPSMMKAAELFKEQGKLNKTLMLNTLKRGQIASFTAQFSKFTDLPIAVVIAMLQQKSGYSLAIACKGNEIDKNEFFMIFNFTRKIMGEDLLSKTQVSCALVYYDRITSDVAKRLMKRSKN